MTLDEAKGRITGLEALVSELILRLPPQDARELLSAALPGLQRSNSPGATNLAAEIGRRIRG